MKDIFLLDLDDTLFDFRRGEREQISDTLAHFGFLSTPRMAERFHEINDGLWKGLERGEVTRERLLTLRFEMLFAEFDLTGDAALLQRHYFEGMSQRAYLMDGAKEFLAALGTRGRRYAVTNGSAFVQSRRLAAAGIDKDFDAVFISEAVGYNKPSPAYADYVKSHIPNFDCSRAVWVGDSLTSDRGCAQAMGVDFILFRPGGRPAGYEGLLAQSYPQTLALIDGM